MQSLQRRMGRMLPRTADESQVAVLLKDFEDVDQMLDRLIKASKAWRDAWQQILTRQAKIAAEFDGIYRPIIGTGGSGEYNGAVPLETPEHIAVRSLKLQQEYTELEADMKAEVNEMDLRVIRPAEEAKASIQPLKKTIKKRQDRKLDFERYQGRYDSSMKKIGRSDRENRALNKHEGDLARSKDEYAAADEKIREHLPAILQGVFALLPYILAAQIIIQNNLLGHCYTQISEFCQEEGFPVPAPAMPAVTQAWERDYLPVRDQVEQLQILKKGKAVRQPMRQESQDRGPHAGRSLSAQHSPSLRSVSPSARSVSPSARSDLSSQTARSMAPPSPNLANKPSMTRVASNSSQLSVQSLQSQQSQHQASYGSTSDPNRRLNVPSQTALALAMPNYGSGPRSPGGVTPDNLAAMAPAGPNADYFSRSRAPSAGYVASPPAMPGFGNMATTPSPGPSPGAISVSSLAGGVAAKKKPPPPPPPKKKPGVGAVWVTALYDFAGQSNGDLTFREGDRIKVIKKTDSTQDWWEGELAGVRGQFPANYCQVA